MDFSGNPREGTTLESKAQMVAETSRKLMEWEVVLAFLLSHVDLRLICEYDNEISDFINLF
jgi:hypothetical protein